MKLLIIIRVPELLIETMLEIDENKNEEYEERILKMELSKTIQFAFDVRLETETIGCIDSAIHGPL